MYVCIVKENKGNYCWYWSLCRGLNHNWLKCCGITCTYSGCRNNATNQNNSILQPFCICFPHRRLYKVKSKHSSALRNVIFHQGVALLLQSKDLGLDKQTSWVWPVCLCLYKQIEQAWEHCWAWNATALAYPMGQRYPKSQNQNQSSFGPIHKLLHYTKASAAQAIQRKK